MSIGQFVFPLRTLREVTLKQRERSSARGIAEDRRNIAILVTRRERGLAVHLPVGTWSNSKGPAEGGGEMCGVIVAT